MRRDDPLYIKARAVCKKVGYQFPQDLPEQELSFAVIERAIIDLIHRKHRQDALDYLFQEEIPEAARCGVDSGWIQLQIIETGLLDITNEDLVKTRNMNDFL